MPPPYDLIKVDIEGGEFDMLEEYRPLLDSAGHILMEWHAQHRGGGGESQLIQKLKESKYEILESFPSQHPTVDHSRPENGVWLLKRAR